MNKKGQGISMTYIIIAALALVVLVVIVLFFTGGIQSLVGGQKDVLKGTVPDWQIQTWSGRCKLACSTDNVKDYCETKFGYDTDEDGNADVFYVCDQLNTKVTSAENGLKDLGVGCDDISC